MRRLTFKQRAFAENYVATFGNASRSARLSGYSTECAKQQGHRLLQNERIQAEIRAHLMANDPQEVGKQIGKATAELLKSNKWQSKAAGVRILMKIHRIW